MLAALIPISRAPLQVGGGYIFEWNDETVSGHIRSIAQRLQSSLVAQPADLLLQPGELASVEIEASSSQPPTTPVQRMQRLAVVEPATKQIVAAGLLIPGRSQDESISKGLDAQPGLTVWLTGLSGAGKTTIARQVQDQLCGRCAVETLDGDIVRTYLSKDLGYSKDDRNENVRRLGFVARLLSENGIVVLVTAISPYREIRDEMRRSIGPFVEVYVNAPIATCEQRDVKGLYKKARAGEIRLFTGIDDPYEPPLAPEVECQTDRESIGTSAHKVLAVIEQKLTRSERPFPR
jgi:adenylyl-sulfate kinase